MEKENNCRSHNATILGTWQLAPSDGFWTDQCIEQSEKVVSHAVKNSLLAFDTAQSYGKGQAEQTLGKILGRFNAGAGNRFLVDTKFMPTSKPLSEVVSLSLSRLRIPAINRFYIHWPRTDLDLIPYFDQMKKLRDQGLISKIGLCNPSLPLLENLVEKRAGLDCIQIPLSLLWSRDIETLGPICRENGISIIAYSPSGMGLLSGRYRVPSDLSDARKNLFCFTENCIGDYQELVFAISEIAKCHSVSNTAVALAWTASKKPDSLIIGARNTVQLAENLASIESVFLNNLELERLTVLSKKLAKSSESVCSNIFSYNW